jgi:hypothetical protein
LAEKLGVPSYAAEIACPPGGRLLIVRLAVAVPDMEETRDADPSSRAPSKNRTVPVGVPLADVTVAVRVTLSSRKWGGTVTARDDCKAIELLGLTVSTFTMPLVTCKAKGDVSVTVIVRGPTVLKVT